jgi:hypothetical protein
MDGWGVHAVLHVEENVNMRARTVYETHKSFAFVLCASAPA